MPCRAGASGITVDGVGNPKMETISIKVSAELSARVSRLAARKATTRSAVIRAAIEAYSGDEERSFARLAARYVGAIKRTPADLSTNRKHLKGFGR